MDGQTAIARDAFYGIMARLTPSLAAAEPPRFLCSLPFDALPWPPHVSLALFVHRVQRLAPGLYLLARATVTKHPCGSLRSTSSGNGRRAVLRGSTCGCCKQPIAGGRHGPSATPIRTSRPTACSRWACWRSLNPVLKENGPWFYPRLFWETGLIGQVLYLEAEAAGIRGTGIGCFFDDAMHDLLGIHDRRWQSLYHFTVGGPVEDPRLQTIPPYAPPGGEWFTLE